MPDQPDALFADPRLAAVYDALDPDRGDLDEYEAAVAALEAQRVLDIGCGTGVLARRLAHRGMQVIGLDPAAASIVAMLPVDAVTMSANVAQVFTDDAEWSAVLAAAHRAMPPGGLLVFEARRREARAWESWTPEQSRTRAGVPGVGAVERWVEVVDVVGDGELVTFDQPTVFLDEKTGAPLDDGTRWESRSTLRFRTREEIEGSLETAGFTVDALDLAYAPGCGRLYLARRRP
ncbi:class I SAM-dependent methyltransferase [Nesterenkonia sp. CL21]|uniref:class I SAM-dependent methyltransferase n=1 Tax=Nesterenkonia sp. CL21 TaxID=3064894 RepID=UPI002878A959|nr:class I SAM-dependent methyltransferase [Nesterenkonia sp. CL21]MDS2174292.1 class I SAM-dependent methyltransferase [Nesterenkonia sp. CL21]